MLRPLPLAAQAVLALILHAQSAGELVIRVADSSGAPMRAAAALDNLATGVRQTFPIDSSGVLTLRGLPLARYRIQVSSPGFVSHAAVVHLDGPAPVTREFTLAIGPSSFTVDVVSGTPLPILDRPVAEIPAPIQTAGVRDMESSGATQLADFLNRRLAGVYVNEIQGNPLQPDVNYRGYTASPLLGTPQGLSLYMDGVRLNQPFGEVASWDLIPRIAIEEMALVPGSNPLFGLNTLGGALSIRTREGSGPPRTGVQISAGSFGRKMAEIEHGGAAANGFHWFLASSLFFEDGWRQSSPSDVRQFFGKTGRRRERTSVALTLAYANNALTGNGLQELRLLVRDYSSYYTKPDVTANRSPFAVLNFQHAFSPRLNAAANGYFRYIRTLAANGDINDASLDQSVYQPNAAERAALAAAGYSGFPAAGASAANTPFPFWRCLANVLLRDEPAEKCNALLNRSSLHQRNYGLSGQVSASAAARVVRLQLTAGAAFDANSVGFSQSTQLGYLNPDRSVIPVAAFADGVTGGNVDGQLFDLRVHLAGSVRTASVYATGTMSYGSRLHVTVAGRFNRATLDNHDRIQPVAGPGSLSGAHAFQRFNPAAGATFALHPSISLYASYSEGSRAPSSVELGCADPADPCKLPNAIASDPPLRQIVTRTVEAGLRSPSESTVRWSAGFFRAANVSHILFAAAPQSGFGYFRNFGETVRQGLEISASARVRRLVLGGGYTFLDATFRTSEQVSAAGNSSNNLAASGFPGLPGVIRVDPGDRIPLIPRQTLKAYADLQAARDLSLSISTLAASSSFARGNENNAHAAGGLYLGPGLSPGYAVLNASARWLLPVPPFGVKRRGRAGCELFADATNLAGRRFYTAARLGPTGFTADGRFIARPFPATPSGEFPVQQSTFFAPGASRAVTAGLRVRF